MYISLIIVKLGTSLHCILNTFSNITYSLLSGQDSARSYGLNPLDGKMADLQDISFRPSSCHLSCIYMWTGRLCMEMYTSMQVTPHKQLILYTACTESKNNKQNIKNTWKSSSTKHVVNRFVFCWVKCILNLNRMNDNCLGYLVFISSVEMWVYYIDVLFHETINAEICAYKVVNTVKSPIDKYLI